MEENTSSDAFVNPIDIPRRSRKKCATQGCSGGCIDYEVCLACRTSKTVLYKAPERNKEVKKCATESCGTMTVLGVCDICRRANQMHRKKCATQDCDSVVMKHDHCVKCRKGMGVTKKCTSEGCQTKTKMEYCSACIRKSRSHTSHKPSAKHEENNEYHDRLKTMIGDEKVAANFMKFLLDRNITRDVSKPPEFNIPNPNGSS